MSRARNILFLANTNHNADCVAEHISAVQAQSKHNWFVLNSLRNRMVSKLDLNHFDAVGFHYSIHPHESYYCSKELFEKVRNYTGVKFLFLQDEYENVDLTSSAMFDLGMDILFTVVRPELHYVSYDHPGLAKMKRVTVMAGYAPNPESNYEFVPIQDRNLDIFYRSRVCPLNAGTLGYEKSLIARMVKEKSKKYNLNVDISVREEDRLYGKDWIESLSHCRATLGTESGASVWDRDGGVARELDKALGRNPNASFEELFDEVLKPHDGKLLYSSISPRIFEAAALKTPQILFPGWYNELIEPGVHYFELKKDFSNFRDQVHLFTNTLYSNYVSCYIKKEKPLIEFPEQYRTHMFNIHKQYLDELKDKKMYVTITVVIKYVNNIHPSLMMFCLNYHMRKRNVDFIKADTDIDTKLVEQETNIDNINNLENYIYLNILTCSAIAL